MTQAASTLSMPMSSNQMHDLAHGFLDGRATEADVERLSAMLRTDAAARDAYLRIADMHACLAVDERIWCPAARVPSPVTHAMGRRSWLKPLVAAVVGLAVGLGSAGLVFAYVVPMVSKSISLLREGFESGPAPVAQGLPTVADVWSGDRTAVVSREQTVSPRSGEQMLRIMAADYDGKSPPRGYVGDLYRIIDLRPHRDAIAGGQATLNLSALMNAIAFRDGERYVSSAGIYALDDQFLAGPLPPDLGTLAEVALASARRLSSDLDRDVGTWQAVGGELRLPASTSFVLVHVSVFHGTREQQDTRSTFEGHYVDDVRVWLDIETPRVQGEAP